MLERDGAVILSRYRPSPDSLVLAAAEVLGTRLRHVQPARTKDTERSDGLPLHNENRCQVIEVQGQVTDLYGPDADYLLILCAGPSDSGGASVVADGYRLFDRIRDGHPELWRFLTGADVDRLALVRGQPDIPTRSSVCRHLEYTRCLHGVDAWDTRRITHSLTVRSVDAR